MKNVILITTILILMGISGYFIYYTIRPPEIPKNLVVGTGRIDGDLIFLNAKYAGRVEFITVNDGDRIKKGEIVAKLKSDEFMARLEQTNKAIESTIANRDAAKLDYEQSVRDFKRAKSLFESELISESNYENAMLAKDTAKKRLDSLNYQIKQLRAQREEVLAMIDEMTIRSPGDCLVIDRIAQPGMVIGEGGNILLLIDPKELYLKLFVDTIANGKIEIGDVGQIFLDAYPDKPIPAKVVRIEERAEFTPKEVQIKEDRIQLMFAVHLKPVEYNPLIKLGLPAIGVISLDGKGLLKSSRPLGDL
ncbi:MAG: efflux RND transporter periplasmic adaptor subunit [Deferribacterota bacterium]|nr:efflux RND transporter periplasmic adaptor subunit [Deferribacterota bacterium]